jgi:hypothetical protein
VAELFMGVPTLLRESQLAPAEGAAAAAVLLIRA